jgi:hypothetical protein
VITRLAQHVEKLLVAACARTRIIQK